MRTIIIAVILCIFPGVVYGQNFAYRNGLNGNGSFYNPGSTNYPSGVYSGGNFFPRVFVPGVQEPVVVPGYYSYGYAGNPYARTNRNYGLGMGQTYRWQNNFWLR